MKIVLRHRSTGRYYRSPDVWVRRSDNALTFDDEETAREFTRLHRLPEVQPVHRLAAYLMPLLQGPQHSMWESCRTRRGSQDFLEQNRKLLRN